MSENIGQKNWDKIHDPNLSWTELKKVLDTTRNQANDRLNTVDSELAFTQDKLRGYRTRTENKPPITPAQAIEELRRRGKI